VAAAHQIVSGLRLHASTQMTITSPEGLAWAARLGIEQAVLARECSLRELEKFSTELPLEVFVHGALCVAYSGQCLTSEALGQRSANRGECAQACRMPYELVVDGERVDLGDRRYLLSPQDLAAIEAIPELVKAGMRSFKIEGRLKSPEYVSAITAVYRRALDAALEGVAHEPTREDWYAMEMTFSRGLYSGWVHGVDHQKLVAARFGKKRGTCVGRVARVGRDSVELEPLPGQQGLGPLAAGDGVVFDTGGDTEKEQGGRIFQMAGGRIEFGLGVIDFRRVPVGALVWKTDDPHLNRTLRKSRLGHLAGHPERKLALNVRVTGAVGQPLGVRASLPEHPEFSAEVFSRQPLLAAEKQPLDAEKLRAALGKLEETPFRLERLDFETPEAVFLPIAQLNEIRRALLAELARPRSFPPATTSLEVLLEEARLVVPPALPERPQLLALCRTDEQIVAAVDAGVETILLDFEDLRRYGPTMEHWRGRTGSRFYLGTPRIQKAGEEGFFKMIERAKPDGVVVRNLGALTHFAGTGLALLGDFSLNVANPLTAAVFLRDGLERVTASYDLEAVQVGQLAAALPPGRVEVTLHQHMPMFHMEHCVFAAFLSKGKDYRDCGRPCEKHRVHLRDRVGKEHPLRADVGCRNTLFNAVPQSGAGFYEQFLAAGIRHFRVEFLEESEPAAREILQTYRALLAGELMGEDIWRKLRVQQQLGVTRGPLQARRPGHGAGV
jgi:putative protease